MDTLEICDRKGARPRAETTDLLEAWAAGDGQAGERAIRRCYEELRSLARARLRGERPDHTLEATDLVHEVLARRFFPVPELRDRAHFVGRAGQAMRALLVDHARRRGAAKRGAGRRLPFDEEQTPGPPGGPNGVHPFGADLGAGRVDVLDLDLALVELEALAPARARLVELRFFLGLGIDEAAQTLGISRASAIRQWRHTRGWLRRRLEKPRTAPR